MEPAKPSATDIIKDKIRLGILPSDAAMLRRTGRGASRACDGCDEEIGPNDLKHELVFAEGAVLHFHAGCTRVWERLRTAFGRGSGESSA